MGWLSEVWTKLKVLRSALWSDTIDTYKRVKILLLAILGAVIYFEWAKLKALWLVKAGQSELKSDNKQDQALAQKENQDNQQADVLVTKAQNEPNPGDDWNTK